ncbi:MAG TPA: NADH:ubiquinone reductase (Na(+)-transporting) subunit C, partial [Flavobacteriaceae bacterium]|nr:NADH:ubiquinone reductase (Na(+)-transporting) subunit C [Flavobacteriaceae bacterium]
MDRNSNAYTFIFAVALVVIVAAVLAFTATSLKPLQDNN